MLPSVSGWKVRSSQRWEPVGKLGWLRMASRVDWRMRCFQGSAYWGMKRMWL